MKQNFLTIVLLSLLNCSFLLAQDVSINGRVLASDDNEGTGLPGVSVQVKGTNRGTTTDAQGNFRINAPATARLVFSFIGYASQETAVGNQSTFTIRLVPDVSNLEEIVVTTFGTAKKAAFTGSAGTLSTQQIQNRPISNVIQALSGAVAGVQTTAGSGQPGTSPDIRIRGFGSISSGNDPLYVVDGVPYSGSIANLSPNDIESITVLKDAASTALYGSRAANGVVVVTTKKGQKDRSTINVRYTKGISTRDEIMFNRRVELWGEGVRFTDLKRLNQPLNRNGANISSAVAVLFDVPAGDNQWEFLIPRRELNANKAIVQNPL